MPFSLLTLSNLNHSLCGFESDPVYEHFNLGKWYWLWAELYLTLTCLIGFGLNATLVTLIHYIMNVSGMTK